MGKILNMAKDTPSGLVDLHVLVRRSTVERIIEAAKAIEQPRSVWLRMAIVEKLERDAK